MIFHQRFSKHFPHEIQRVALRKLIMLNRAKGLDDLRVPPGNRLEALSGNREGQYSIRLMTNLEFVLRQMARISIWLKSLTIIR